MSDQPNNNSGGNPPGNNPNPNQPRRNNNRRRHNNNRPRENAPGVEGANAVQAGPRPQVQGQPRPQGQGQPRPQGQQQGQPRNPNQQGQPRNPNQPRPQNQNNQGAGQPPRKKPNHPQHNRPRTQHNNQPSGGGGPFNIERIYEKYLNLLDQHIIARRKYHDLFYRADPAQKNKLERNFYNTLNDIREFESKLAPDVAALFEKRNNGYSPDRTYTSNHELPIEGEAVPADIGPAEPHLLQSQIAADYSGDVEESVGTAEDYLKYKNY